MIMWVDVETTGLDEKNGHLLEVAMVLTDDLLVELASTAVVVQPVGVNVGDMKMDDVVREMHTTNGLLVDVNHRGERRHLAEQRLLTWVLSCRISCPVFNVPLAGSTVSFDRRWLREHMPELERAFSYRSVDVSSLTELAKRWAPAVYEKRPKAKPEEIAHRALADARQSVAILRYYLESGFVNRSAEFAAVRSAP